MNTTEVINKICSVVSIETLRGRESPCHGREQSVSILPICEGTFQLKQ